MVPVAPSAYPRKVSKAYRESFADAILDKPAIFTSDEKSQAQVQIVGNSRDKQQERQTPILCLVNNPSTPTK